MSSYTVQFDIEQSCTQYPHSRSSNAIYLAGIPNRASFAVLFCPSNLAHKIILQLHQKAKYTSNVCRMHTATSARTNNHLTSFCSVFVFFLFISLLSFFDAQTFPFHIINRDFISGKYKYLRSVCSSSLAVYIIKYTWHTSETSDCYRFFFGQFSYGFHEHYIIQAYK